jgi:exosome complex RNA-binding protein Rrp42 (RNase PH superfamily)
MDDELYNSGFKVDKLTRLASLGNLAKVVTKSRFDGVNYHEDVEIIQETTKNLFFKAAYDVGELMSLIFQVCNNVLFFWVDAVFLSDDSELLIISNILATYGLEFSVYRCEKIIGTDKTIEVHSSEHKKKERTFMKEVYTSDYFVGRFKDYLFETKIKRT